MENTVIAILRLLKNIIAQRLTAVKLLYCFCGSFKQRWQKSTPVCNLPIELIKREIDHTDNNQIRNKALIIKEFINSRFPNLAPDADIEKEYEEFEKEAFDTRVSEFSENTTLPLNLFALY